VCGVPLAGKKIQKEWESGKTVSANYDRERSGEKNHGEQKHPTPKKKTVGGCKGKVSYNQIGGTRESNREGGGNLQTIGETYLEGKQKGR